MNSNSNSSLSKRLRNFRVAKNLTAAELARQINVPISTYREWEQGRLIQGEGPYLSLAQALDVSVHELISGIKPPTAKEVLELLGAMKTNLTSLENKLLSLSPQSVD